MLHVLAPCTYIHCNLVPVLAPLAERCHVIAMDLIGFGLSERKCALPYFDVDLWIRQAQAILKLFPVGSCGVAGHSLGGALALKLAAGRPRIVKVLTSSAIGASFPIPQALDGFWSPPADRQTLHAAMAHMVHDPSALTEAMIEDRWQLLSAGDYPGYFAAMFAPPRQRYIDSAV